MSVVKTASLVVAALFLAGSKANRLFGCALPSATAAAGGDVREERDGGADRHPGAPPDGRRCIRRGAHQPETGA